MATSGNYFDALLLLGDMVRHNPQEDKIWATRAFVNTHQGNLEAAVVDWSEAIRLREEPHYYYMRGINFFQMGHYKKAVLDFTRVIELCGVYESDYYRAPAYFFRADAHLRLKQFEQAKSDCMHVRDDMQTWTDKLRTKADILAECTLADSEQ